MISGATSRFRFMNADGTNIELPRTNDKLLAYSFFIDQGDEWQDVLDKLGHFDLIDPKSGKINARKVKSPLWSEVSGLKPERYERLAKLVEDGARPRGSLRRRSLTSGECLSLGLTLKGTDDFQHQSYSNLFFNGFAPSRFIKVTINNIYFSMTAVSEAPTIAAFEKEGAPVFLYSEPKISLHNR